MSDAPTLLRKAATTYDPAPVIREAREALGWSQSRLADELGLGGGGRVTVSRWECGERRPDEESRGRMKELAKRMEVK